MLNVGSTITQAYELARVFSHKPFLVVQFTDEDNQHRIKHTGTQAGYVYQVIDPLQADDIYPHPQTTMGPGQEWLTKRVLRVKMVRTTQVDEQELLTDLEVATLQRHAPTRQEDAGK
jgi:hypothetical protein